ncbi:MAG: class I tRNA ligase family protein, partial [Clostridia bacterium]|nr:class I tRNA ligase family protein [Clostridia bacterium]
GRKMSKSLGNGIDPLEVIDRYGADALRFTLATGNSPGNDMRYSEKKVEASRNFANKLWNAARFILMNLGEDTAPAHVPADLSLADKWIISRLNTLTREVTENLERFELGIAVQKLYDFIWDVFCDWYIELAKIRLQQGGEGAKTAGDVLVYVMTGILKLLHPFMPFITEEIWQAIPHEGETIMTSAWPEYDEALTFTVEESAMERIMEVVRAVRNRRAEMNVPPAKKAKLYIASNDTDTFADASTIFMKLAGASEVEVGKSFTLDGAVNIVTHDAKVYIPMGDLVDFEAERARLNKELAKAKDDLAYIGKKLNNPSFVEKAPAAVVQMQRDGAAKLEDKIAMLEESLAKLG